MKNGKNGTLSTWRLAARAAISAIGLTAGMAIAMASASSDALAARGNLGVGIVLGEPSGLSAKYWLRSRDAVDFGLAYSFDDFFAVFSDYLFHFPGVFGRNAPAAQITPYLGVGAILLADTADGRTNGRFFTNDGSSVGLGLRIPLGVEWRPSYPPLGIFLELVPGLGIIPSTFGFLEAGIGGRFYF
jgi:hypothetical protein